MNLKPLALPEDEIHVWCTFPEEIRQPQVLEKYYGFMDDDESGRQRRFHFERHRHQFLITRAMIRSLLSRYVPEVKPEAWRFDKNEYGRPFIAKTHDIPPIHFNLSHTEGMIVCGVVMDREVGIDVEDIQRGGELISVADRFFSPQEVKDLHKLPESKHTWRFFDYWTLKESYIKARGMGLSIPLEQFSFHLSEDHAEIAISIDERQNDAAERWQFRQWAYREKYKLALALERREGVSYKIVMRKLVPLVSEEPFVCEQLRDSFD